MSCVKIFLILFYDGYIKIFDEKTILMLSQLNFNPLSKTKTKTKTKKENFSLSK